MNTFDIVLLAMACVLVVIGMFKGLVRILIGLGALVAAFALAARYHRPLADRVGGLDTSHGFAALISYVLIFLAVMLTGGLIAYLLRKLLRAAMLSWADRLGGAALGLVAAALIAALLVLPLVAYSPGSSKVLADSRLAPYVVVVSDLANAWVPEELSQRYREGVKDLRRFWHGGVPEDSV